jgi:Uma2 family endonuclease
MSYEDWLVHDQEGGLSEWIDGEAAQYMSATKTHQKVVEFLLKLMSMFARLNKLGEVHTAPYAMRAKPQGNAREPDLLFVSTANAARATDAVLIGPADLVVEVISEDSVARDHDEKFYEYEAAGVREYWIVDPRPNRNRSFFYSLDGQGRYQPVPVGDDGIYHSLVLTHFWLKVDGLWMDEPNELGALAEIVGSDRLLAAIKA